MAKTDIKLNATDPSGKTTTASVTYVNPEATNAQLKQLGQMLNAMTENVYESTYRINTIHCDSEVGPERQTPTFTLSSSSITYTDFRATINNSKEHDIFLTYDGDGKIFSNVSSTNANNASWIGVATSVNTNGQGQTILRLFSGNTSSMPATLDADIVITYRTEETNNFWSVEATFTITA